MGVPGLKYKFTRLFWNNTTVVVSTESSTNASTNGLSFSTESSTSPFSMDGLAFNHEEAKGDSESIKTTFFMANAVSAVSPEQDEAAHETKPNLRGHRALTNIKHVDKKNNSIRDQCLSAVTQYCEMDPRNWECCLNDSTYDKCTLEVKGECDLCWYRIQEQCMRHRQDHQDHTEIIMKQKNMHEDIQKILTAVNHPLAAWLANVGHVSAVATLIWICHIMRVLVWVEMV